MTVEELIDELKRINPKSRKVYFYTDEVEDGESENLYLVKTVKQDSAGDIILEGELS